MLIIQVRVKVKENSIDDFIAATLENAKNSIYEPGIIRFDFMQDRSDKRAFLLTEIYIDEQAPLEHKKTDHYIKWRKRVADMMAEPRQSEKYNEIYPTSLEKWKVQNGK